MLRFHTPHRFRLACLLVSTTAMFCHSAELRPLSTDRPDTTESPRSVDAGHFQFELELGAWSRDGGERSFSLFEMNAKYGLDDATDLQVVLPFYTRIRHGDEGFGDMEIRLKHNLWGNDEGETAMALMPYVKLPTANADLGNGALEGGLIVPYGFEAGGGWSCGVMGEIDLLEDEDGSGYEPALLVSATASHALTECSGFFVELVGLSGFTDSSDFETYFNTGMNWAVKPMCQIDFGIRVGLNDEAEGFTPFLGFSTKL